MSTYRLKSLFAPRAVAVIGASPRQHSIGRVILGNLRDAGFKGPIEVVNPHHPEIGGQATVPSIGALDPVPDLVVITAPAPEVPGLIEAAGVRGVGSAIVITGGMGHGPDSLAEQARRAARTHKLRLLGPSCLGLFVPSSRLNATFSVHQPKIGDLALISQSGGVAAGLVEWAAGRSIGFSGIASIGDAVDIDFSDLLDYFALDRKTRAILMYIESISDVRKFMSAARAAARVKPVIAIKAGRYAQAARTAATHTGLLAGGDAVYNAAFRRAGLLRVFDLDELFAAAETLGRLSPTPGKRVAIIANGGGIGILAADRILDLGGTLADLSPTTVEQLNAALPPTWSRSNPVDIIGDADATRYSTALDALLEDEENDAILVMNVPTALASSGECAEAVINVVRQHRSKRNSRKPVLAVWVGDNGEAAKAFDAAGIPYYSGETDAIRGFMHLVRYVEANHDLMEMPPSVPTQFVSDTDRARKVIAEAIDAGKSWLDPLEVNELLAAYGIPITQAILARDGKEAAAAARPFLVEGQAVVVKILSPDIIHKSEVDGVRLNLLSKRAVEAATDHIIQRARLARPNARIIGVTVHPMHLRPKVRELIIGVASDPVFGPVVLFGTGGVAVEVINDKALALPPLDMKLAGELIDRTRVSRLLKGYRNVPPANRQALELMLVKVAQLVADLPEVQELDLNPVLADEKGMIAVDARIAIAPLKRGRRSASRFAIRPYPREWERHYPDWHGRRLTVRPVRPEDEGLYREFFGSVSEDDLRLRFFAPVKEFSHTFVARLTQIDYARAMALIVVDDSTGQMLGAVRIHSDVNHETGEYAILVRSDLKGVGLGWLLMKTMIDYARAEGLRVVEGQVLRDNTTMLRMCTELGFQVTPEEDDPGLCHVLLDLEANKALMRTPEGVV
jgi:acetyltransferase